MIHLKRAYEQPSPDDGYRILVDRLWPRGVTKEKAALDLWMKDIAPSPELRKWFGHEPSKWEDFQKRYREELMNNEPCVAEIKELSGKGDVTLIFGAKDIQHNEAVVLKEFIDSLR